MSFQTVKDPPSPGLFHYAPDTGQAGFAPQALKSIRFGVQQRLNPRTVAIFSSPAYGLRLVTGGLPMLLREARAFSNRLPEIVSFNDEFRLRIHGV